MAASASLDSGLNVSPEWDSDSIQTPGGWEGAQMIATGIDDSMPVVIMKKCSLLLLLVSSSRVEP